MMKQRWFCGVKARLQSPAIKKSYSFGSLIQRGLLGLIVIIWGLNSTVPGFCATTEEAAAEILRIAMIRRIKPISLDLRNAKWVLTEFSNDYLILSLTRTDVSASAPESRVHILSRLCKIGDQIFVIDAAIIMKGETPDAFNENNYNVGFDSNDEFIKVSSCIGAEMSWNKIKNQTWIRTKNNAPVIVWSSEQRMLIYTDVWSKFFAAFEKNYDRSKEFLMYSIRMKTDRLIAFSDILADEPDNVKLIGGLQDTLALYDSHLISPVPILHLGISFSVKEINDIQEYFATTIKCRKKIMTFYPEQSKFLKKDYELLRYFDDLLKQRK